MNPARLIFILLRLVLGGMMIYGGLDKFDQPMPEPLEVVEKAARFSEPGQENTLQKILYISGAKQTGYFWQVLGVCELLFGILLVLQYPAFIGAVFLLPITVHIFLFHLFLEPDARGELLWTGVLLAINITLVLREWRRLRPLAWQRP